MLSTLDLFLLPYNAAITLIVASLFGITLWNLRRFRRLAAVPTARPVGSPRVSILVPARDEERCIEACIHSLCEQDHPNVEVIVMDDGSTDRTPQILARLAADHPDRLTVLHGTPLPEGWVGKSWACHNLALHATGDVFVFTDADTVHRPTMVRAALDLFDTTDLDFFSLIPYEELGSFAEHAVIPMVHVLYFAYIPNDMIHRSRRVSVSAANGQFMCFRRDAYVRSGGHASVHDSMVEDVFLAKNVKRAGLRIALVDGTQHVSCRMYTSAAEVHAGFSKNFFPATNYNLPLTILFILHLLTTFTFPLLFLLWGVVMTWSYGIDALTAPTQWSLLVLPVAQLILAGAIRSAIAVRFRMPAWHALLQPITAAWAAVIGLNSIYWAYSSAGPRWKGRTYATNRR